MVSTGGVSAGDSDWIRPLLAELGEVAFWKLFLKPGRPFAFGRLGGRPFFGLPGNPVAAAITALQLLWPALQTLEGGEVSLLPRLQGAPGGAAEARARAGRNWPGPGCRWRPMAPCWRRWRAARPPPASVRCRGPTCCWRSPPSWAPWRQGCELWAQLLRLPLL